MIIFSENEIFRRAVVASIKKSIKACAPGVACTTIDKASQDIFKRAVITTSFAVQGVPEDW